ncbi:hypothetical protein P152DRAFT_244515 [Eremomyces bilateralis CBS 781.70]|uniref:Uncharacterized protein n=1 Tax=Eremomyces bilateralis CBS 781.70 TaxID=1392243 RepID=A0A6G1GAI2_9PEZI|nr:uncharacterized protein P152DRAFT_244515 [Eremomyces bilateralis CBS 781.70]KAF1815075.1 hypothetical protein P152DRAFT_244515 [Eremomyces bilateralis CBS 781.70]
MILLQANGTYDAKVQKAGLDYTTAIKACMNNGDAPYIAVFEDDVIFSNGWVARTVELLSDLEAQNEHWSDMRLFTPERSMGWSPTTVKLATFLSIAPAILAAVLIPRIRILRKAIDPRTVRWVVPIVVPLTVWFILEAGKYSIFPPSPGLHQQRWGCCTQAIVFSRKTLSEMVPCLDLTVLDRPYDLAIRDCAFSLNLHRWIAQPSLVQHLGFKSLINPNRSSADAVWSVSFEDMDGHAVLQQQKRLVQQIYGSSGILS